MTTNDTLAECRPARIRSKSFIAFYAGEGLSPLGAIPRRTPATVEGHEHAPLVSVASFLESEFGQSPVYTRPPQGQPCRSSVLSVPSPQLYRTAGQNRPLARWTKAHPAIVTIPCLGELPAVVAVRLCETPLMTTAL